MTTVAEATKGVPKNVGDPAPTLRADHNALADWVRDNVDRRVATKAARNAIAFKYVGLIVQTADTNSIWMCIDAASTGTWRLIGRALPTLTATGTGVTLDPETGMITLAGGAGSTKVSVNGLTGNKRVRVTLRVFSTSAGGDPIVQMRSAGGGDDASANYTQSKKQKLLSSGAVSETQSTTATGMLAGRLNAASAYVTFELLGLGVAERTWMANGNSGDGLFESWFDGRLDTGTAYDGFSITFTGNTVGEMQIDVLG